MPRNITEYTLKKASEHVFYEVAMFFKTAQTLSTPGSKPQDEVNILLDAFAIHTRNLYDFLYPTKPRKDDIIVDDFLENRASYKRNRTKKKDLEFIKRKTDKQVAHLTYARNRYSKEKKGWFTGVIAVKMYKTLQAFYDSTPLKYHQWPYFKELKKLLDRLGGI